MTTLTLNLIEKHLTVLFLAVEDDAVELGLEPLHGVLLGESVRKSHTASLATPVADVHASPAEDNVEVHPVDPNAGVVLDAQVDVLLDAEAKVSVIGKVLAPQLVLLHLQSSLQDLLSLGSPHCAVDSDLLVPPDTETPDGVAGLGEHRGLSS